jgi:hypothetical protein
MQIAPTFGRTHQLLGTVLFRETRLSKVDAFANAWLAKLFEQRAVEVITSEVPVRSPRGNITKISPFVISGPTKSAKDWSLTNCYSVPIFALKWYELHQAYQG